ncbi:hypothetical protein K3495_g3959 [Podosphaera aphanis]|nr:hypothetical protein K3495_g3959 [Podosphaera aphanis]
MIAFLNRRGSLSGIPAKLPVSRPFSSYLVSPAQLKASLQDTKVTGSTKQTKTVPLCASWFLPNSPLNGLQVFREKRLPSARFFDIDKVCDKDSPYPHMIPSASEFARAMSALGITKDDRVVVYDSLEQGIFSAPRVAWMLRAFGHKSVHILNNFKIWVDEGYPTESGEFWSVDTCVYPIPQLDTGRLIEFNEIREIIKNHVEGVGERVQILDARSRGRWTGKDQEPRAGISSGHMPGSISLPFTELLDPETKALLPRNKLKEIFKQKKIDPERPIITSCGTGVTAAIIEAALHETSYGSEKNWKLYDGSWTEWALRTSEAGENVLIMKEE